MKKKLLQGLLLTGILVGLTGCTMPGLAKTPTLEDIRDNLAEEEMSSSEASAKLFASIEATADDYDTLTQYIFEELDKEYGIDLIDDNFSIEANLSYDLNCNQNEDYAQLDGQVDISVDSNSKKLNKAIEEGLEETPLSSSIEAYIDFEDGVAYAWDSIDECYYKKDLEETSSLERATLETDTFANFLDFVIEHNDNADKEDQIKVVKDKSEYIINAEFTICKDTLEDMSKSEKKALNKVLSFSESDIDVDWFEDFFDNLDEYDIDVEVPVSVEMRFSADGKGEDVEYFITGATLEMTLKLDKEIDKDLIEEYTEKEMGQALSFTLDLNAEIGVKVTAEYKYDEDNEVEIPKKVKKNAIDLSSSNWN